MPHHGPIALPTSECTTKGRRSTQYTGPGRHSEGAQQAQHSALARRPTLGGAGAQSNDSAQKGGQRKVNAGCHSHLCGGPEQAVRHGTGTLLLWRRPALPYRLLGCRQHAGADTACASGSAALVAPPTLPAGPAPPSIPCPSEPGSPAAAHGSAGLLAAPGSRHGSGDWTLRAGGEALQAGAAALAAAAAEEEEPPELEHRELPVSSSAESIGEQAEQGSGAHGPGVASGSSGAWAWLMLG